MSNEQKESIGDDYYYTKDHEWIRVESQENNTIVVGISEYAAELLGSIVHVSFAHTANTEVEASESILSVDSAKSSSDIFSPSAGTLLENNEALDDEPELINKDHTTWMFKMKANSLDSLKSLMKHEEYQEYIKTL